MPSLVSLTISAIAAFGVSLIFIVSFPFKKKPVGAYPAKARRQLAFKVFENVNHLQLTPKHCLFSRNFIPYGFT